MSRARDGFLLPLLMLVACATAPAGEDAKGRALLAQATPVLEALARYRSERGEYPRSLHELVPRYLREVPFDPGLNLDRDGSVVEFAYGAPFPRDHTVHCIAQLGDRQFTCREAP